MNKSTDNIKNKTSGSVVKQVPNTIKTKNNNAITANTLIGGKKGGDARRK